MSIALKVVEAIDEGYEKNDREESVRDYIGASAVGHACDAMLAFSLRGYPDDKPGPRLRRIFRMGHILEDEVVRDLKKFANVTVWEKDGLTGKQYSYEELGGHIVCHMDGHIELADSKMRVLEIKSMNDASWKKFVKEGVKISHPRYFAQCQMMMGMSGIHESFFIAVNKNTSEYHAEIIAFESFEYSHIQDRVNRVLSNQARRISEDESDWRCRDCFKRSVCWGKTNPQKACQTCTHSYASANGGWHCSLHDRPATDVCDQYDVYKPLLKE